MVPATVANLGPGFDILALAVDLCNEVFVTFRGGDAAGDSLVTIDGSAGVPDPDPKTNLIVRSYLAECQRLAIPALEQSAHFICVNRIPFSRGLGSSAAATVSGVLAAHVLEAWLANPTDPTAWEPADVIEGATVIEGHPDNVAACVLGGFVICSPGLPIERITLSEDLRFVLFVPDTESLTNEARSVVPSSFSRADAVFNASRIALLVKAMVTSDFAALGPAMEDRWHQPYRASLLPALKPAIAAAGEAGAFGTCLSGSGSSILAISSPDVAPAVGEAMAQAARKVEVTGTILIQSARNQGTALEIVE